jgi:hypothetical protein
MLTLSRGLEGSFLLGAMVWLDTSPLMAHQAQTMAMGGEDGVFIGCIVGVVHGGPVTGGSHGWGKGGVCVMEVSHERLGLLLQ